MVGLSIVLESQNTATTISNKKSPQVINKFTMIKASSSSSPHLPPPSLPSCSRLKFTSNTFLDECFLCKQTLLNGIDIYMYKGDRAFCSVDCRFKQMSIDEAESF